MKRRVPFLLLAILSLLLSGCTIRPPAPKADDYSISIHFRTTVKSNGSGDVEVEYTESNDLVDLMKSQSNTNPNCNWFYLSLYFNFDDKSQGGNLYCIGSVAFTDSDQLTYITENKLKASVNRIEIKDRHFYYDISMSGFPPLDNQTTIEALWTLVLPGTPGDNNADTISGRTLTWDLSNTSSEIHMTAECAIGGGLFGMDTTTMTIIAVVMTSCCCVIVLAIVVVVFVLLRRKDKQPAAE